MAIRKLGSSLCKSIIIAFSLILTLIIFGIGYTNFGIVTLVSLINPSSDQAFEINELKGTLFSGITITSISGPIDSDHTLSANNVAVQLEASSLILGKIVIKHLKTDSLLIEEISPTSNINRQSDSQENQSSPFTTQIPALHIKDVTIKKLTLRWAENIPEIEIQQIRGNWNSLDNRRDSHLYLETNYQQYPITLAMQTEGTSNQWIQKANLHFSQRMFSLRGSTKNEKTQLTAFFEQTSKTNETALLAKIAIDHQKQSINAYSDFNAHPLQINNQNQLSGILKFDYSPDSIELQTQNFKGKLANKPFLAESYIKITPILDQNIVNTSIHYGDDHIETAVNLANAIATWKIDIHNLGNWYSPVSGRFATRGNIISTNTNAEVNLKHFSYKGLHLDTLDLQLRGLPQEHQLSFMAKHGRHLLTLGATSHYENQQIHGSLDSLVWREDGKEIAALDQHSAFSLTRDQITLQPLCITSRIYGSLCTQFTQSSDQTHIEAHAESIDLGPWSMLLMSRNRLTGTSSFDLLSEKQNGRSLMSVGFQAENLQLIDSQEQPFHDLAKSLTVNASLTDLEKNLEINGTFEESDPLVLQLNIKTPSSNASPNVLGKLQWQTDKLHWLDLFGLESSRGHLSTHLNVSGTLARPSMQGEFNLSEGQMDIPSLNISLEKSHASVQLQEHQLNIKAATESGKGTLNVDAKGTWLNETLLLDGSITGQNVLVINSPDLMIYASPNLTITQKNNRIDIQGQAEIPNAEIKFQNFDNIATLPDEAIMTASTAQTNPTMGLSYDLNLICGDHVAVNTYGIQGMIDGKLLLHKQFFDETLVDGQLKLNSNAKYRNDLGIVLAIESGILNYTNKPFDSPSLYLRAIKKIDNIKTQSTPEKVGINIEGPINELRSTYFAEPTGSASSQEILSYLILGTSSSQELSDDKKNALIFNAIQTLGSNKTGSLNNTMKNIQNSLNLNELQIELDTNNPFTSVDSDTDDSFTSIKLGKQLSKKIYVQSNIGMPMGLMTLRYLLSDHWSLEASGSYGWQGQTHPLSAGADFYYTF